MTPDERDRLDVCFEVKVRQFTHAMARHGCRGEAAFHVTEIMIMWPDIGYDQEHCWLLN